MDVTVGDKRFDRYYREIRLALRLMSHGARAQLEQFDPASYEHDTSSGRPEAQRCGRTDTAAGARHHDDRPVQAQVRKSATSCDRRRVHRTSSHIACTDS